MLLAPALHASDMIRKEEVYKIGLFNKPHGVKGELSFTFVDDIFDRVDCDYLICQMDGILVPFFIEEYRFKSGTVALVKLEGVDTAEDARRFTNVEVYFPVKYRQEDVEAGYPASWHYFEGFYVDDVRHGRLGQVLHVDDSTANVLFTIFRPDGELLVPVSEELVLHVDHLARVISMELPDGLLEL